MGNLFGNLGKMLNIIFCMVAALLLGDRKKWDERKREDKLIRGINPLYKKQKNEGQAVINKQFIPMKDIFLKKTESDQILDYQKRKCFCEYKKIRSERAPCRKKVNSFFLYII